MSLPFTVEQFLDVFKNYNRAVFPMQLILYCLGAVVIYLTLRPNPTSSKIISSIIAIIWMWIGIVYHIIFFTTINKAAYLFGAFFIIQGILFLIIGVYQNKLSFQYQKDIYGISGILLIVFALVIYPILGYLFGHVYPSSPTFGLPCPTTIFTFGLLLLNTKKCCFIIQIIPFVWALIGFMAAFQLGFYEDIGMVVLGVFTLLLVIFRNIQLNTLKKLQNLNKKSNRPSSYR